MEKIRVAIAGLGNCASALIQGIHYYRKRKGRYSSSWFDACEIWGVPCS